MHLKEQTEFLRSYLHLQIHKSVYHIPMIEKHGCQATHI